MKERLSSILVLIERSGASNLVRVIPDNPTKTILDRCFGPLGLAFVFHCDVLAMAQRCLITET